MMTFEHVALNVPEPLALVQWYVAHCDMQVLKGTEKPPYMHFLGDATGRPVLEVFRRGDVGVPDYFQSSPLHLHVAFKVEDIDAVQDKLLAAGATFESDETPAEGTRLVMLRDPWGIPLQLCKRQQPLA